MPEKKIRKYNSIRTGLKATFVILVLNYTLIFRLHLLNLNITDGILIVGIAFTLSILFILLLSYFFIFIIKQANTPGGIGIRNQLAPIKEFDRSINLVLFLIILSIFELIGIINNPDYFSIFTLILPVSIIIGSVISGLINSLSKNNKFFQLISIISSAITFGGLGLKAFNFSINISDIYSFSILFLSSLMSFILISLKLK